VLVSEKKMDDDDNTPGCGTPKKQE